MSLPKHLKVAIFSDSDSLENVELYLKRVDNVYGRILHLVAEAMHFSYQIIVGTVGGTMHPNGTWTGLIGMLNRSEADIAAVNFFQTEQRSEAVSFAYPFSIDDLTFITNKPEYSPQVFSIFRTLSSTVWIALGVTIISVVLVDFTMTRHARSFDDILLQVLAICLHQTFTIKPSTAGEKVLHCSWMVGVVFLSHIYSSVLLSFLTFPPLSGVRDVPELAKAIERHEYNCMMMKGSSLPALFLNSNEASLRVIGENILQSVHGFGEIEDFFALPNSKIAYINSRDGTQYLEGMYFVSKDSFLKTMQAMAVRKGFCCKKILDSTIHRIVASGFYQKIIGDRDFRMTYRLFTSMKEGVKNRRKLTITDISSTFIFLF